VEFLYRSGLLNRGARVAGARILHPDREWWNWIQKGLLAIGAALRVAERKVRKAGAVKSGGSP
jgi:hypothetical protein